MCSFIFTNTSLQDLDHINFYNQRRGPDQTTTLKHKGFTFIHNLLSITGSFTPQPFVDKENEVYCIYNGEIYNYEDFGSYTSDGSCLIPLYIKHGPSFVKKLDGEFALVLVDFKKNLLLVSTDVFATKPLWIAQEEKTIGIASYESPLARMGFTSPQKFPANTYTVYDLSSFKKKTSGEVYTFDLRQHKNRYDDFIIAWEKAIAKRVKDLRENVFIGLSSGYDSGAIACELHHQHIPFKAYTIVGSENQEIIDARCRILNDAEVIKLSEKAYQEAQQQLPHIADHFVKGDFDLYTEGAVPGLNYICEKARKAGYKVYLSGQGSDEIISDYGADGQKIYAHSELGGKFPENLKDVFPYANFFGGTQEWYINKEEYTAGAHGIETRFPFLDKHLVQEFLWLTASLKNASYKAPVKAYLERRHFPFAEGQKIGFEAYRNLRPPFPKRIVQAITWRGKQALRKIKFLQE